MDPYCCDVMWDHICAAEADECNWCNGDCCKANKTPGCEDEEIEECVCEFEPYCCDEQWDQFCVKLVEAMDCGKCQGGVLCGDGMCANSENCHDCPEDCGDCCGNGQCQPQYGETCQTCMSDCGFCPGEGSCCIPKDTPGCHDVDVQSCVCEMAPFCCEEVWDKECAYLAEECNSCSGECCEANPTPGCDDLGTEMCVCDLFGDCCEEVWDDFCATAADKMGCAQCGCLPQCQNKECGDDGCGGSCGYCPPDEECNPDGYCEGQAGYSCSEILQCAATCGGDLGCMMGCSGNGTPEGQQLFMNLMGCVLGACSIPPSTQCMIQAFMTTCNEQYQECAAN